MRLSVGRGWKIVCACAKGSLLILKKCLRLPCEESFKKPEVNGVVNGVIIAN